MNSCTSAGEKGWSIGLVTAILDGESLTEICPSQRVGHFKAPG